MSGAQRLLEQQEAQWRAALAIAIQAKVLRRCEFHSDIVLSAGERDVTPAYRIGNAKFTAKELEDIFESRTQLTDAIKGVVEEHPLEDCPLCDNLRKD